jgi:hypothetical protein
MKIKEIKSIGRQKVYDLSVKDAEHYILKNGVVTHNTGITYSADNIWILGRQQDKDGTEIQGYHFIINVEKSRFVKEKSKIPISVSWEGGIQKWSGLLDVAIDGGYVVKPKNGWYMAVNKATGEQLTGNLRAAQTMTADFWEKVFSKTDFAKYIKDKYTIGLREMITDGSTKDLSDEEILDTFEDKVDQ